MMAAGNTQWEPRLGQPRLSFRAGDEERTFVLERLPVTIGREAGCDLRLESRYVSRRHARLDRDGDRYVLAVVAATNPTAVNGEPVTGTRALAHGDAVRLADVTLTFLHEPPQVATTVDANPLENERRALGSTRGLGRLRGTLTILFTDIEGSTRLGQELGDRRWQEVLRAHNEAVRTVLEAHTGHEVKTVGDGFIAVFEAASDGIRAAIAIQQAIAALATSVDLPLRVRAGLNLGEVISEDDDFFGSAVVLASRLMSRAAGGQVLVSDVVAQVASPTGEFRIEPRGSARLKGFARTQRFHEVVW